MWVFLIVNRLLHQLVVGFSSHKWAGSKVGTSRVTRPGVRWGYMHLSHMFQAWLLCAKKDLDNYTPSFNVGDDSHVRSPYSRFLPSHALSFVISDFPSCTFQALLMVDACLYTVKAKMKWSLHSQACCSLNEDSFDIFISLCNWFVPLLVEMCLNLRMQIFVECYLIVEQIMIWVHIHPPSGAGWWSQFGVITVSRPLISLVVSMGSMGSLIVFGNWWGQFGVNLGIHDIMKVMVWYFEWHIGSWTHTRAFFVLVWWYDITVFWLWR
jgi:hypothetical protein